MPPRTNNLKPTPAQFRNQLPVKPANYWLYGSFSLILALCAVLAWALFNITTLKDWYVLATYHPPTVITQLAVEDGMTNYARRLFYVNKPQIENKSVFATNCTSSDVSAHVIGCYHSGDNGIFLLNVSDPRLKGIIEVTAAYEMLHAGYARLNSTERNQLDQEMWQYYTQANISTAIKQQMASYAISEPGARYDELYSVLGTEVNILPQVLENHFKLYFNNRASIVARYNGYEASFTSIETAINTYSAELTGLRGQIDAQKSQLNSLLNSINAEQTVLNNEKSNAQFAIYNSGVAGYNNLVNQYNQLANTVHSEITQYNQIVSASNALAIEDQQLVEAITSSPSQQITK